MKSCKKCMQGGCFLV